MNRRSFGKFGLAFVIAEVAGACSRSENDTQLGSPTAPTTPSISTLPSRTFLPSLGGDPIKTIYNSIGGTLYESLNAAGIILFSREITSRDTQHCNASFSGHLIYAMIFDGVRYEPPNGFNFNIGGKEYYDPVTSCQSRIADYYQLPVRSGETIEITLPPKWNGLSD